MNDSKPYATFYLDQLFLGVEVRQVQEIISHWEMTPVPLAPLMIRGLINLRGQIVTAIDLRRRFELPPLAEGRHSVNVVIRSEDGAVSLLVDEIGEIIEIQDDLCERRPETVSGIARELVTHVYQLETRLLLILDLERTISLPEQAADDLSTTLFTRDNLRRPP